MDSKQGLVGAIRQNSLPLAKLAAQERHGKRLDETSAMRKVRNEQPLVWGGLDLRDLHELHMQGVQRSKGARTACIHAYVQYPTSLIDGTTDENQFLMLSHAVRFLNRFHGGQAVFSARLDRDERGRHGVDVFLMPRYQVTYKDGRKTTKASPSKYSKQEAKKRFGRDDVRAQGSALQASWFEYLRDELHLTSVQPPERKKLSSKDRVEPEAYGVRKDQDQIRTEKRKLSDERNSIDRARAFLAQEARVLRNLQIAAGRPLSRVLDDLLDVNQNER